MIILPWPDRILSPNSPQRYWRSKSPARITAREYGVVVGREHTGEVHNVPQRLTVTFFPPNRKRRDLDNLLASIKPYLDGVCIGLGVDDSNFRKITITWGEVVKQGQVQLELEEMEW